MPVLPPMRLVFRHPTHLRALRKQSIRHASTLEKGSEATSNAAARARGTASNIQSKASEGLTRVTSVAGPALSGAAKGIGNAVGSIGGRTGRLVQAVQAMIPPTIYYSKVGLELGKIVFQGQKMAPPSLQTFQHYFTPILHSLRSPSTWYQSISSTSASNPDALLSRIRNINRAQLLGGGVVFAEVLGFFSVGEILGKMKIIGYRGSNVHHEH